MASRKTRAKRRQERMQQLHRNTAEASVQVSMEELAKVEEFVNEAIRQDVPVVCEEMSMQQAKEEGATGIFESKYGDVVKVYTIEGWSKEICGGPHASHTGELGHFKIKKEQSSSAGVRRIKAVLEGQEE